MTERSDLDALDQRAGLAAADLRTRSGSRPIPDPSMVTASPGLLVPLPARGTGPARRWLAVAAALALLAGAAGWWSTREAGDTGPATETVDDPRPFVLESPDWLLQAALGAEPNSAPSPSTTAAPGEAPEPVLPGQQEDPMASMVIFGPSDAEPRLAVVGLGAWEEDGADAELFEEEAGYRFGPEDELTSRVVVGGGRGQVVLGRDVDRSTVAAVLDTFAEPGDPTTAEVADLPDGWRPIPARTSPAVLLFSLSGAAVPEGLRSVAAYSAAEGTTGPDASLVVAVSGGGAADQAVDRLLATEVRTVTVRGREATLVSFPLEEAGVSPYRSVAWQERPGEVVRVSGTGIEEVDLLAAAEQVEPVTAEAFAELVRRSALGELSRDSQPLDSGAFPDGTAWSLRTSEEGALELRVSAADGAAGTQSSQGFSTTGGQISGEGDPVGEGRPEVPAVFLETWWRSGDRMVAVFRVSDPEATVEFLDAAQEPVDLAAVSIELPGGGRAVVADLPLSVEYVRAGGGDGAGEAVGISRSGSEFVPPEDRGPSGSGSGSGSSSGGATGD